MSKKERVEKMLTKIQLENLELAQLEVYRSNIQEHFEKFEVDENGEPELILGRLYKKNLEITDEVLKAKRG
jgi:hypothetical protein